MNILNRVKKYFLCYLDPNAYNRRNTQHNNIIQHKPTFDRHYTRLNGVAVYGKSAIRETNNII